jgi:hypothetical protein
MTALLEAIVADERNAHSAAHRDIAQHLLHLVGSL